MAFLSLVRRREAWWLEFEHPTQGLKQIAAPIQTAEEAERMIREIIQAVARVNAAALSRCA